MTADRPDTHELVERAGAAKLAMPGAWFTGFWPKEPHVDVWRFIAACSPETIVALAARLAETERERDDWAAAYQRMCGWHDDELAKRRAAERERDELVAERTLRQNPPLAESLIFRDPGTMSESEQAVAAYVGRLIGQRHESDERAKAAVERCKTLTEALERTVEVGFLEVVGYRDACAACGHWDEDTPLYLAPLTGHDEDCPLRAFEDAAAALRGGSPSPPEAGHPRSSQDILGADGVASSGGDS